jgi:hypothetical protein
MAEVTDHDREICRRVQHELIAGRLLSANAAIAAYRALTESVTRAQVLREVLDWVKGYDVRCFEVDGDDVGFVQQADLFVFLDRIAKGAGR